MKTCGKKSKGKNLKEDIRKKNCLSHIKKKQGGSREKHNGMWGKAKIWIFPPKNDRGDENKLIRLGGGNNFFAQKIKTLLHFFFKYYTHR